MEPSPPPQNPQPQPDVLSAGTFHPATGTPEQWDEAYSRLSDYFRAHRIHNRLRRSHMVMETLQRAAKTHAAHPEFTPVRVAIHEVRKMQKMWLRGILGELKLPESRLEANGRLAFLMCDGPHKWPEFYLHAENPPPELAAAMRQRVERSGPDLEVSRMVPREIDLGLIPDIADDTFDLFDRYPLLRSVFLLVLALLAALAIREGFFR